MNEHISMQRLWWLLRADFTAGYRLLLMVSGTLAGIILIAALLPIGDARVSQSYFVSWYGAMLLIWGLIASSRAFGELHDKTRNEAYLLIPASPIEKTLARLLPITVGLGVYLLALTCIASLLVAAAFRLFGAETGVELFNPLDPELRRPIAVYLLIQPLYFLGASWFRRRHFIKTTLVVTLASVVLVLFLQPTMRLIFDLEDGVDAFYLFTRAALHYEELGRSFETLRIFVAVLLPAACWSIAWLRVRETQVSDGV